MGNIPFKISRLKTGTPPRIDSRSIDFSIMDVQLGDKNYIPFSFFNNSIINLRQLPCYITYTNHKTHSIINKNLKYSPIHTGYIKGVGTRYCPSIEDKVVRFENKASLTTAAAAE